MDIHDAHMILLYQKGVQKEIILSLKWVSYIPLIDIGICDRFDTDSILPYNYSQYISKD